MATTDAATDRAIREKWKKGDIVQLFSRPVSSTGELQERKWQKGKIMEIFNDSDGEWLTIKYCGIRTKQVQRFADDVIRPMPKKTKKKKVLSECIMESVYRVHLECIHNVHHKVNSESGCIHSHHSLYNA